MIRRKSFWKTYDQTVNVYFLNNNTHIHLIETCIHTISYYVMTNSTFSVKYRTSYSRTIDSKFTIALQSRVYASWPGRPPPWGPLALITHTWAAPRDGREGQRSPSTRSCRSSAPLGFVTRCYGDTGSLGLATMGLRHGGRARTGDVTLVPGGIGGLMYATLQNYLRNTSDSVLVYFSHIIICYAGV